MRAERTVVIFGLAAILVAVAVAVAVRADRAPSTAGTGAPAASVGETLRLTAQMTHERIAVGPGQTEWMVVDVDAIREASVKSGTLDLVIVVDKSSSMVSDHKLDDAKAAARQLVERLERGDRVGLVSYGTQATKELELTLIEDGGRGSVLSAIDALEASGGTNISAGLTEGYGMLRDHQVANRVRRMIVLSDGKATAGVLETAGLLDLTSRIREKGVSVTAMGLGLEFNELLLTQMADVGGGNYYYIREGSRLAQSFDREFSTLQQAVATETFLRVEPAANVEVRQIHGFHHLRDGRAVIVPLSAFYAGQNKSLLVELSVVAPSAGEVPVASLSLQYVDVAAWEQTEHSLAVSLTGTTDATEVASSAVLSAIERREQVLTATAWDQAMERFEAGENGAAEQILNERGRRLRELSAEHELPSLSEEASQAEDLAGRAGAVAPSSAEGMDFVKGNRSRSYLKKRTKMLVE